MSEKLARCPQPSPAWGDGLPHLPAWLCPSVSSPKAAVPAAIRYDRALGMPITMIREALQYQSEQQGR